MLVTLKLSRIETVPVPSKLTHALTGLSASSVIAALTFAGLTIPSVVLVPVSQVAVDWVSTCVPPT
jgi:hypothetical protein